MNESQPADLLKQFGRVSAVINGDEIGRLI